MNFKYKVIMLGVNECDNITMASNLSLVDAMIRQEELQRKDSIHYYEVRRMN